MKYTKEQVEKAVESMFRKFDNDKNGVLDGSELKVLLTEAHKLLGNRQCTDAEVNNVLEKYDKNGDGVIDREELTNIFLDVFSA